MYEITIKVAGRTVKMNTICEQTLLTCVPYQATCQPDFEIQTSRNDILNERIKSTNVNQNHILSDTLNESAALLRKVTTQMLKYEIFLMHGSVIATGSDAFMFTAKSGVGKTTRSCLWLEQIPGSYFVNGDKPLLKVQENDVLACGTPWSGKEKYNTNTMVPLRAIFLLERAEQTSLQQLTFSEAFSMLLQQTYRPSDPQLLVKTIRLLKQLDGKVKFYRYRSSLDDADMRMLYRTVMNQEPPAETGS